MAELTALFAEGYEIVHDYVPDVVFGGREGQSHPRSAELKDRLWRGRFGIGSVQKTLSAFNLSLGSYLLCQDKVTMSDSHR